jgi:hypothetical protein
MSAASGSAGLSTGIISPSTSSPGRVRRAWRTAAAATGTVRRLSGSGRLVSSTPSQRTSTAWAAGSVSAGQSITATSASAGNRSGSPAAVATFGHRQTPSAPRHTSPAAATGSASTNRTRRPAAPQVHASASAAVVRPVPPLWLATAKT